MEEIHVGRASEVIVHRAGITMTKLVEALLQHASLAMLRALRATRTSAPATR